MHHLKIFIWSSAILFLTGCSTGRSYKSSRSMDKVIRQDPLIRNVLDSFNQYESQIVYIRIDRNQQNIPRFQSFHWNLQPDHYFYPASMVKMPTALLAAEKINQLNKTYPDLDLYTPMKILASRVPQTEMTRDSTAFNKLPSVGHLIKKIFLVSDNDAFNRLYEFLGQEALNTRLRELGYSHTHIIHRLDAPQFDYESNKYTNPIAFYHEDLMQYNQAEQYNAKDMRIKNLKAVSKGTGYLKADSLIHIPFDFSEKNYFSLGDMASMIQSIMFPESIESSHRFDLSPAQWGFIRKSMSTLPRESRYPAYDSTHYDGYCKFFLYGDQKGRIPDHIRIFNKVGWAYGFLTDAAYIVDFKNKVEFILAATVKTNRNDIYNDGMYEYESIGLPYLSKLGTSIYYLELHRKKKIKPDLTAFKFDYTE